MTVPSTTIASNKLDSLLAEIAACNLCADQLPHAPRPVLRAGSTARILVIGQAPGTRVHATGIPWNDPSGRRLRQWMHISDEQFYNQNLVAIVPMGFCYPGKGKSGDLPPRPECAPQWHDKVLELLPELKCTLLIGQYAQNYYLDSEFDTLTERVQNWQNYLPSFFVLPHPSPRNLLWLRRNPWFEADVVPSLQQTVKGLINEA